MMGRKAAEFDEKRKMFAESVIVTDDGPFVLKPVILAEGKLKGSRVLLVEPTPRVNFVEVLPAELRNKIYERVLRKDGPIRIHSAMRTINREQQRSGKKRTARSPSMMALPLVNKQAAAETTAILYGLNTFEIDNTRTLSTFLKNIPTMRKHLKNIVLPHSAMWIPAPLANRLDMVKLETRVIESESVVFNALTGPGKVNIKDLLQKLLPFLRGWHTARGRNADDNGVLDVVKFAEFRDCKECHKSRQACEQSDECRGVFTVRVRGEGHLAKVSSEFKGLVAEKLGISI